MRELQRDRAPKVRVCVCVCVCVALHFLIRLTTYPSWHACYFFQVVADLTYGVKIGVQGGAGKWGRKLMTIILSNHNRFAILFTGRFAGKFAIIWL